MRFVHGQFEKAPTGMPISSLFPIPVTHRAPPCEWKRSLDDVTDGDSDVMMVASSAPLPVRWKSWTLLLGLLDAGEGSRRRPACTRFVALRGQTGRRHHCARPPACARRPDTALMPTPPTPIRHDRRRDDLAAFTADPQPVGTARDRAAAPATGSRGRFVHDTFREGRVAGENALSATQWATSAHRA